MRFRWRDAEAKLASYLPQMKNAALSFADASELPNRRIQRQIDRPGRDVDLRQCNLDFFFAYDVFPRSILKFFGEWQLENREMRAGDTIVQQAQLPPGWGAHFIFGVRVLSVYREATRAGFNYGTLAGHPETGVNEFSFSLDQNGVVATVHTTAQLGHPLTRLLAPFTRRYVNFCNQQALHRMREKFLESNREIFPP